ncbi:M14 metallopeptidase family protein [Robertkochia solimangrovi]|uniref:M14 metallopeptidase family protein n=1 Tax=Robertkochia solimangrovi TaxID=2213046 RepID=UPI001180471C|nr:M14 metallopeptidase family protein [Robertkochia solimangrovi]TRZ41822.1 zinc carboxypeptidase [Robertkochia solimangrovi]
MNIKTALLFIFLCSIVTAQKIQSPSDFLGYHLGSEFSRHHQVIDYYEYLAETLPDQVKLIPYGKTYEGRELLLAVLSSPENISNLETIKKLHQENMSGKGDTDTAIVWLSYNVHGNESVSTEASMKTAYELLKSHSNWLKNTVVIIDPCINPDGRDRYVNWYNQNRNHPNNVNPDSREHHEPWASGRPNHYLFDLNRDWAWLTQVESQQRIAQFSQWVPHIHVDFHEQGINNPYFFAPASEPMHEVITDWQKEFQLIIGKNHARYFDANGWFYFTKEVFDLLYPSYGDTYPIYNGSIGMTYEQGGSGRAGLGVITASEDTLTLNDRIDHHFTTGLSTVEMASTHADRLITEFRNFHRSQNYKYHSYAMTGDPSMINTLSKLLDAHGITYGFTDKQIDGIKFNSEEKGRIESGSEKLVISTDQPKGTLVKVLFEPNTKLSDSLTYDITAWSLPYAYGLNALASEKLIPTDRTTSQFSPEIASGTNIYAYVTEWHSINDAKFLSALLTKNIKVRTNHEEFRIGQNEFDNGSLIITRSDNASITDFDTLIPEIAKKFNKSLFTTNSGFVDSGKDFGSSAVQLIKNPKIAMLSGGSVSTLNFGEIWHFFEQQLKFPVTVIDDSYFNRVDLNHYDILILPEANNISEQRRDQIKSWVKKGGKLIAIGQSLSSLAEDEDFGLKIKEQESKEEEPELPVPYSSRQRSYIKNMITGAIFKTKVDNTNPLAYGYGDDYFSLKLDGIAFETLTNGSAAYIGAEAKPVAGFAGSEALKTQENSLVFGSTGMGRGTAVYLVDNPVFRAFWENGKLFFANAIFMVD